MFFPPSEDRARDFSLFAVPDRGAIVEHVQVLAESAVKMDDVAFVATIRLHD